MIIISIKRRAKKMGKKYEFVRKMDYMDSTIKTVRDIISGGDFLAVPNKDSIIVYCNGVVFGNIENDEFKFSGNVADEHRNFSEFAKNRKNIIGSYKSKMSKEKERKSSQIIALNNMSFDDDRYSVCGWECTINSTDIALGGKAPEIDMVAVCPKKKEIILIEYKCKGSSMLDTKNGIDGHYSDYKVIIKEPEFVEHLKTELLKSFDVAKRIYSDKPSAEYDPSDFVIKIGFLFADNVTVNNENSSISDDDYAKAYDILKKAGLDKETVYIRAANDRSVRLDNWKTVDGSGLAVTQK